MSGGTRCNLTQHPPQQIVAAFETKADFSSPRSLPCRQAVVRQFNRLGVETKVESTGKVFPDQRSRWTRDALLRWLGNSGAELKPASPSAISAPPRLAARAGRR